MTRIENQRNGPVRHQNENGSKERLEGLAPPLSGTTGFRPGLYQLGYRPHRDNRCRRG